jgi:hypothetical protein
MGSCVCSQHSCQVCVWRTWLAHGLDIPDDVRLQVMRRYHIQDRDDYTKYNKVVGMVTKLTNMLRQLDAKDPARIELTDQLLDK